MCRLALIYLPHVFFLFMYFEQNGPEISEEEETDDEIGDPEYVPPSQSDTEDDEPSNRANSKSVVAEDFLMDQSMDLDNTNSDISVTEQRIDNTTIVAGGRHNFCFVCKKASSKLAQHFKTHVKEDADIAQALSLPVGSRLSHCICTILHPL